jgi:hypothetical protein
MVWDTSMGPVASKGACYLLSIPPRCPGRPTFHPISRHWHRFRWLFIIEGVITLLSSFLLLFFLPDYPARAKWLSEDNIHFAEDRVKEYGGGYLKNHASRREVLETFLSPRMVLHYIAYVSLF